MKKLVLFASLVLLLESCNPPSKEVSQGEEFLIAYNVHIPDTTRDDYDIFTIKWDGTERRNIINNPDVAWTFEAYKDKLYFISDRDTCYRCFFLYETDAAGSIPRKVSDLQLEDSWMSLRKDGGEMVVTGRIGKTVRHQLFIMNLVAGTYTQLTNDTTARYGDPCFSPDGRQIVFSYKKNKRDKTTHEELFLMNDDGSGMVQLTSYPEDNPSAKNYGYRAGAARWHPTDKFISYVSLQDGRHSIFAVSPDGRKQWKLTTSEQAEGWHDWSPDGKWLAFNTSDWEESQYHISLMNWETKEIRQITDSTYKAQQAPVFLNK